MEFEEQPVIRSFEKLKVLLYQKPIIRVGMAELVKLEISYRDVLITLVGSNPTSYN